MSKPYRTSPVPGVRSRDLPIEVRFLASYTVNTENGCWEWIKPQPKNGYGGITFYGKQRAAHVVSWILKNGEITEGLCVLHDCDNRRCVNPDHLHLGTKKQNRKEFMERHPRAKELMASLHDKKIAGLKNFWGSMSAEEKKRFCKNRSEIQSKKRRRHEGNHI